MIGVQKVSSRGTEKVIQQILCHANVNTTATYYIKRVPAQVNDAMEKLEQAPPMGAGCPIITSVMDCTPSRFPGSPACEPSFCLWP